MPLELKWTAWNLRGKRALPSKVQLPTVIGMLLYLRQERNKSMLSTLLIHLVRFHCYFVLFLLLIFSDYIPGHVDFTIEVERALRVLDGAILVLCAVAGVQVSFLSIWIEEPAPRVMLESNHHGRSPDATIQCSSHFVCQQDGSVSFTFSPGRTCVSELLHSPGANPWRIIDQIRNKLRMGAAAVHIPIGSEDQFKGVVDLVRWKAVYNEGSKGYVLD